MSTRVEQLLNDVRQGSRILTSSPGLSVTAALLLALVVGGSATVYSAINSLIDGPAPGVTATDLVAFSVPGQQFPFVSYTDYEAYAGQARTFRSIATTVLVGTGPMPVRTPEGSYLLRVVPVTGNYFETLGVRTAAGRPLRSEDDREGAPLVAVISDRLWRSRFRASSDAVGQDVTVRGQRATVIGVAPPGFNGPFWGSGYPDLWVPIHAFERTDTDMLVGMIGRLRSGASLQQARADIRIIQASLHGRGIDDDRRLDVVPYASTAGSLLSAAEPWLMAFVSILTLLSLVVVCANVANLMLARALGAQRDMAVRQAVGASRARIVRLMAIEGLTVAAVASLAAFVLAWWAARLVPAMFPEGQMLANLPADFTPDWRVGVWVVTLTLAASACASAAPSVRSWRQDPLPLLKSGTHTTTAGRSRISSALVVVQLALSALLITAAGLAYRAWTLSGIDIGFDTRHMLITVAGTTDAAQSAEDHRHLQEQASERLRALPGVASVTYTKGVPPFSWNRDMVAAAGSTEKVFTQIEVVGPRFLETLGVQPISGRGVTEADRQRPGLVAMINKRLADRLWPGRSAVGQTLLMGDERRRVDVIGVVPDAYYTGFSIEVPDMEPSYVLLADQGPLAASGRDTAGAPGTFAWYIRITGPLEPVAAAVPEALRQASPRLAISSQQSLHARLEDMASPTKAFSSLLLAFAGVSLLIATIGQYAVVAFNMRRRTRDFGLRFALGADRGRVLRSVLREGVQLTAVGVVVGFTLSAGAATMLRGILFGIPPVDALTYLTALAILTAVSLLACYAPARRASRIDPVQALRQE